MTLDERVQAVVSLGFPERHARFLVTVALHSGYCVRRQYETFAGIRYGKNVRYFLDGLVASGLAERFTVRADRGHVYHLFSRRLYRALGDEDNRNRRRASVAHIARKIMLLDYVLARPDVAWFATEQEKVDLFINRFDVPTERLPHRAFGGARSDDPATHYFVHKLPVFLEPSCEMPHFVYLAADGSAGAFETFLDDHRQLFSALPSWCVVAVGSRRLDHFRAAFANAMRTSATASEVPTTDLLWYFSRRQTIERGDVALIPVGDLHRFRELREKLGTGRDDSLYRAWVQTGHLPLGMSDRQQSTSGSLLIETLPFSYDRFGSLPGVA